MMLAQELKGAMAILIPSRSSVAGQLRPPTNHASALGNAAGAKWIAFCLKIAL